MIFSKVLSLSDIKKDQFVIDNILWNLEPKDLMEPRTTITGKGITKREPIKGYVFYIDTMEEKPLLFLMRHTSIDFAETVAQIDEIPQEFLLEAIQENKDKACFKMYPINKKIEEWLKKEFGA